METATLTPAPTTEESASPAPSHENIRLWDRLNLLLGKSAIAQVLVVEAVGATNDASWIHHHGGITPMQETTGLPADLALWTVLPRQQHERVSEAKTKWLKKLGEGIILAGLGYGSQKLGVEITDHVHSGLNNGMGEYLIPAVSKIGTLSAVKNGTEALRRTSIDSQAPALARA